MSIQGSWSIPEFTAGDRFRKAREITGQTQREFAATLGIDKNTVGAYETGATVRHRKIVVNAWALATGVPVEWLLHGTIPMTSPDGGGTHAGDTTMGRHLRPAPTAPVIPLRSAGERAA